MIRKLAAAALVVWIAVTGPGGQRIEINAAQIVTTRTPRDADAAHFGPGVRCLIHTTDGKFVAVLETCDAVQTLLQEPD
jgi:hypothetical protein